MAVTNKLRTSVPAVPLPVRGHPSMDQEPRSTPQLEVPPQPVVGMLWMNVSKGEEEGMIDQMVMQGGGTFQYNNETKINADKDV